MEIPQANPQSRELLGSFQDDTCLCIVHTSCGEVTERTFLTGEGVKSGDLGIMFLLCNVMCISVKGGSETIIPKVV